MLARGEVLAVDDDPDLLRLLSLRLIANGMTNSQIAEKLVISENTVKTHIQEIFRKLGVRNRVEAMIDRLRSLEQSA